MNHFNTEEPLCWQKLIQQARDGDDVALGTIASRLQNYLLFVVSGSLNVKLQSKMSASDIVQQSMLEAHQSINRFNGSSKAEIRGWLRRIVWSNLVDSTRRYQNTACRSVDREISMNGLSAPLVQPQSPTASWHVSRSEVGDQLVRAISRLPERQRHVIEARHRLGKSYQEIANEMQVTDNTVRKLWSRGVRRLKEALGEK